MKTRNNQLKVLLVRPLIREYLNSQSASGFESSIGLVPPLNLCCLAAAVEQAGFNVSIFDCEANDNRDEAFVEYLKENRPDVVGISIMTTNFRGALQTARIARRVLPEVTVICGGTHMMIFPRETLYHAEFDYGFIGEAEGPLVTFLSLLQEKVNGFSGIPGLVWRSGNKIVVNEPYGFNQDFESLPFPAYHLLDLSAYKMPNTKGNLISLFLSRGCPYNCGFCFRSPLLKKVRFKSVDRIIDEIGYMVKNYNVQSINFIDETISLRKEYFLQFCERLLMKGWNIEWQSPTRVTSIDEDIVRIAKKAGCHTFRFGIESGSDEILKKINKGITTEKSRDAIRLCKKYGIKTVAYFIIGYLGETDETIRKTIQFAKSSRPDYAAFFPAIPMPDTDLCRECEEKGLIPKDYWRDFVMGTRSDPIPFIYQNAGEWTARAYKSFYFTPGYIFKQMKTAKFYSDFFKNLNVAFRFLTMKFNR